MPVINVAHDFTYSPGPRYKSQGSFSGEKFLEKFLEPGYLQARLTNTKCVVELDGVYGYFDSFLEGSFGALQEQTQDENILDRFILVSNYKWLVEAIQSIAKNTCKKYVQKGEIV